MATCLHMNDVCRSVQLHTLVALAFLGERPPGNDVHHKNNNRSDNFYKNLCYKPSQNHISEHNSCLSNEERQEVRYLYVNQVDDLEELAKLIGVNIWTIRRCVYDLVAEYPSTGAGRPRTGHMRAE